MVVSLVRLDCMSHFLTTSLKISLALDSLIGSERDLILSIDELHCIVYINGTPMVLLIHFSLPFESLVLPG